jgi:rhodanese-related sulfurtransferase
MTEDDEEEVHDMTTSVMEMIGKARARVDVVAPAAAAAELASGSAVLVDVRQAAEWEHGHIDGALPAPRGLLEFFADPASPRHKPELDPGKRMIIVCASGARAALAAATLLDMGYTDVALLDGGQTAWQAAGLPTTEHTYAGI